MNQVFKELSLNLDEKLCYIKNNIVKLTKSEFNILKFFLENRNKIFSREELINNIWKESVNDKSVDTAISRLRKKLGEYGKYIVSRNGFGYGFIEEF